MRPTFVFAACLLLACLACGGSENVNVPDASLSDAATDASLADASTGDSGALDASLADAAQPDAAPIDAGPQPCDAEPCVNGTCIPDGADFSCACDEGWQGMTCATETALLPYIVVTDTSPTVDTGTCAITLQSPVNTIELIDLCPDGLGGVLAPCEAPGISLPEAICAAHNHPGPNTIVLAPETYSLTTIDNDGFGPNGLPPITTEITIIGNGAVIARAETAPEFRFFWVPGAATESDTGGAITAGDLTLDRLTLRGGALRGGRGGPAGYTSDLAGVGGGGGGGAGMGGAIFNEGTTTLRDVLLVDNAAIGGHGGRSGDVLGDPMLPTQGTGGGGGSLRGHGARGGATMGGVGAPGGGAGGPVGSTGFNGGFGAGGGGAGFDGFLGGEAGFGGGAGGLSGGGAGGRGLGGAVFNYLGVLQIENTTFSANRVQTGCHGDQLEMDESCLAEPPAWASGAGVYNVNGTVVLRGVTFAHNDTTGIDATGATDFETIGDVFGAGVAVNQSATVDMGWSVFASAAAGQLTFLSRNSGLMGLGSVAQAASAPSGAPLAGVLSVRGIFASGLRDRGGLTPTVLLDLPPAAEPCLGLDGGPLLADQRGQGRPSHCTPGAFEPTSTCSASDTCAHSCVDGQCTAPPLCPGPRCALGCSRADPCTNGGTCGLRGCDCPDDTAGPTCAQDPSCLDWPSPEVGAACLSALRLPDLPDSSTSTVVRGTIPPGSHRTVWYRVRAVDQRDRSCDNFHLRAHFVDGTAAEYTLRVRRRDCDDHGRAFDVLGRFRSVPQDYVWANDFRQTLEGAIHGQCPCTTVPRPPPNAAVCTDDSSDFFIGVTRAAPEAAGTCSAYALEISNGLYDTSP